MENQEALSQLLEASETAETLSRLPSHFQMFAEQDIPFGVAGLLEKIAYKVDIQGAGKVIRQNSDALTAALIQEGAVTLDGKSYPNAHTAAIVFAKSVLTRLHGAVDPAGAIHAVNDPAKRLPPEQVSPNWEAIRPVLLRIPRYNNSELEARIIRERATIRAQLESETDNSTDRKKKLPPKDVIEAARFIRAHRELEQQGKAQHKTNKTLIIEAVGEKHWESMDRQLRRYKDFLTLNDKPDK